MAAFCDHCCQLEVKCHRAELHHQKQKLDDTNGKRTAADSRISFKLLFPGKKYVRMASLAKYQKIYRQTAGPLRKELQSLKAKFKLIHCSSGFRTLISKSFQTLETMITEERAEATQHVIKEVIGLSAGEASDKIHEEEATDFAAYLMAEINNKGKQLFGQAQPGGLHSCHFAECRGAISPYQSRLQGPEEIAASCNAKPFYHGSSPPRDTFE
jgi:hypothetical protein